MENYAIRIESRNGRYSILNSTFPGSGGHVLEIEKGGEKYKAENLDLVSLAGAMKDLYMHEIQKPAPRHENPDALEPSQGIHFSFDGTDLAHDKGGLAGLLTLIPVINDLFSKIYHERLMAELARRRIDEARRALQ